MVFAEDVEPELVGVLHLSHHQSEVSSFTEVYCQLFSGNHNVECSIKGNIINADKCFFIIIKIKAKFRFDIGLPRILN